MATSLIDTTNFPIYAVNVLSENHFMVAGGGGASKTGIPNAFAFYRVYKEGNKLKATKVYITGITGRVVGKLLEPVMIAAFYRVYKEGNKLKATKVYQHEAKKQAIMNMDANLIHKTFAAGMDNLCRLYNYAIEDKTKKGEVETKVGVKEAGCQTTAVGGDDDDAEYQKCVKFSLDGNFIATASSEGQVKILKHPDLSVVHNIKAHKADIDGIDFHPNSKKFVTISRDGTAYLWNTDTGKRDIQLHFSAEHEDESLFRFRNCKFSLNMDSRDTYLFTTHVQAKFTKSSPKLPNHLVCWDTKKWIPKLSVTIKKHVVTEMAISPNGRYIAVGTADGSILIYTSWNLKLLQKIPAVHNIFVTGLAFLPETKTIYEDLQLDVALLSVSVDNTCHLTTVSRRREYSFTFLLFLFIVVICLLFYTLAHYDINI